ncbi:hypothetical protein C489_21126 [Natrinema versiforme JCM 10478]|uniref:Uncharacterized protein n=1 Tax=Natrinema versiforme JCM 10478 TaxID=1227496 RepID=L9XM52_9EURY|nr:hypothetical protein C489_21126 [Natrinema versiforme JCM 10478]
MTRLNILIQLSGSIKLVKGYVLSVLLDPVAEKGLLLQSGLMRVMKMKRSQSAKMVISSIQI